MNESFNWNKSTVFSKKYIIIISSSQFLFLPPSYPATVPVFHTTLLLPPPPLVFSLSSSIFWGVQYQHSRLCHIGSTWKMRTLVFWVGKLSRHHVRRSILSTQLWSQKSHPFGFRKYQFSFGIQMYFVHFWKTNPSLNWNVM